MNPEAPIGEVRRGWGRWRRISLFLLVSPFIAFLLSNLLLSSTWACRWIGGKIQHRIDLETRVTGASWSPWGGARVSGLEFLQPVSLRGAVNEPIFKCASVRVAPVWRAWLRGRLEIRDIELESPRVFLPLEVLSSLAGAGGTPAPAAAAPPPMVTAPPPIAPQTAAAPAASPGPTAVPDVMVSQPPPPALPSRPTGWLRLRNASWVIIRAGSTHALLDITETCGSIPISGDPAQSVLQIGKISARGKPISNNLAANLEWSAPLLSLKPLELMVGGHQLIIAAKVAQFSGLPLQIEAQLPSQPLDQVTLPLNGKIAAKSISASARFRGLMLAPASWQGDFLAEALSPTLRIGDHDAEFDRASSVTVLRGGILSCVDARMVSDPLSVLGNATLLADGRLAGAARVVAAPESATALANRVFPILEGTPSLTPLSTPQRVAFDVEAFGNISQIFLRIGKDGPVVNLNSKSSP